MTNLDYMRTMSADQITEWLYGWWLLKGQWAWTTSAGALTMLLNQNYGDEGTERLFGHKAGEVNQ